jgi:predicted nuclease of restriction endonuclease-like RecB superfamily
MLPSDLLRYKIDYKTNKINPILCNIDSYSPEYQIAKKILEIFDECYVNKYNKDRLNYMIKALECAQKDYKLIRGLYSIIEKRCLFKPIFEYGNTNTLNSSKAILINSTSMDIRKLVFQESAKNNVAISDKKRNMVLNKISNKLDTDAKTIEKIMWSDLEENTVLYDYSPIDPRELLFNYNVSLIQTLLFNCLRLEIKINSIKSVGFLWKDLLRSIKRMGLMYWLEINSETIDNGKSNIVCIVEGAMNILKLTEKYGSSIAKLVPLIIKASDWNIKANILRVSGSGNKVVYNFEFSDQSYPDMISSRILKEIQDNQHNLINLKRRLKEKRDRILVENDEVISKNNQFLNNKLLFFDDANKPSYDSNIERIFAQKFELFNTGWAIEREPEPLLTKFKTAFILDFILSKYKCKVLVEIVGFWTIEYLERKLEKILHVIENYDNEDFYMILIINQENLAIYETQFSFSDIQNKDNVLIVSYKNENNISFKKIISFLKEIEIKCINRNFENSIEKDKIIKEIDENINSFKRSSNTNISLEDLNSLIKINQKSFDQNFNINKTLESNKDFKSLMEGKIKENGLALVKDLIFKDYFIKEICSELKDKKIASLKEACDFLLIKKIPEKIHIDLLTYMGFKINWNGLDYNESKISFKE